MTGHRIRVFGPSIKDTIEIGDVFLSVRDKRVLEISQKIYNPDLTISYRYNILAAPGPEKNRHRVIQEASLKYNGNFHRVYRVERTILQEESGVSSGTA